MSFDVSVGVQRGAAIDNLEQFAGSRGRVSEGVSRAEHGNNLQIVACRRLSVLANNALRAHHASSHGGVSTNALADILLSFFEMILQ